MPKRRFTFQSKHLFDGKRQEAYFTKKSDGDQWVADLKRSAERARAGMSVALDRVPLQVYCAKWVQLRQEKSDEWKVEEMRLREHILPRLGEKPLRHITKGDIEATLYDIKKENGFANSTFNRYRTLLHKIFEDAIDDNYATENPVSRVTRMIENYQATVATDQEIEKFLTIARQSSVPGFYEFIVTGMNNGARPGENIALTWGDLDAEMGLMHIRKRYVRSKKVIKPGTKSKKQNNTRYIPFNGLLVSVLTNWKSRLLKTNDDDFVFQDNGAMMSINIYNFEYAKVREASGIRESVRLYDLTRHAFATRLSKKGNMRLVQLVLGHSDSKTTERYAHNTPDFIVREAGNMEIGGTVARDELPN